MLLFFTERIAHSHSFVKSDKSDSLKVAIFKERPESKSVTVAIFSKRAKSERAKEQTPNPDFWSMFTAAVVPSFSAGAQKHFLHKEMLLPAVRKLL